MTASQIMTNPKVQAAWHAVEQATHRYGQACLDAALNPQPDVGTPIAFGRISSAEVSSTSDEGQERLTLTLRVYRGTVGSPKNIVGIPVAIAHTPRATPLPPPHTGRQPEDDEF
jgi:hypothetical protein